MLGLFKVFACLALLLQGGAQMTDLPLVRINTPCGLDDYEPIVGTTKIIDIKRHEIAKRPYLITAKFTSNGIELNNSELWKPDQLLIDANVCELGSDVLD